MQNDDMSWSLIARTVDTGIRLLYIALDNEPSSSVPLPEIFFRCGLMSELVVCGDLNDLTLHTRWMIDLHALHDRGTEAFYSARTGGSMAGESVSLHLLRTGRNDVKMTTLYA